MCKYIRNLSKYAHRYAPYIQHTDYNQYTLWQLAHCGFYFVVLGVIVSIDLH